MRRKMNQIISWLETDDFNAHKDEILSPKYSKALKCLIDTGCVRAVHGLGKDIDALELQDHYATYQLERRQLWFNRAISFATGVAVTIVSKFLWHLIT